MDCEEIQRLVVFIFALLHRVMHGGSKDECAVTCSDWWFKKTGAASAAVGSHEEKNQWRFPSTSSLLPPKPTVPRFLHPHIFSPLHSFFLQWVLYIRRDPIVTLWEPTVCVIIYADSLIRDAKSPRCWSDGTWWVVVWCDEIIMFLLFSLFIVIKVRSSRTGHAQWTTAGCKKEKKRNETNDTRCDTLISNGFRLIVPCKKP